MKTMSTAPATSLNPQNPMAWQVPGASRFLSVPATVVNPQEVDPQLLESVSPPLSLDLPGCFISGSIILACLSVKENEKTSLTTAGIASARTLLIASLETMEMATETVAIAIAIAVAAETVAANDDKSIAPKAQCGRCEDPLTRRNSRSTFCCAFFILSLLPDAVVKRFTIITCCKLWRRSLTFLGRLVVRWSLTSLFNHHATGFECAAFRTTTIIATCHITRSAMGHPSGVTSGVGAALLSDRLYLSRATFY